MAQRGVDERTQLLAAAAAPSSASGASAGAAASSSSASPSSTLATRARTSTRTRDARARESRPLRALLRKSLTQQRRQVLSTLCQALVPVIFIGLGLIFQAVFNALEPAFQNYTLTPSIVPLIVPPELHQGTPFYQNYFAVDASPQHAMGFALANGSISDSGLLSGLADFQNTFEFPNKSRTHVPFYVEYASEDDAMLQVQRDLDALSTLRSCPPFQRTDRALFVAQNRVRNESFPTYYLLPTGVCVFHDIQMDKAVLNYTMRINDNPDYIRLPKVPNASFSGVFDHLQPSVEARVFERLSALGAVPLGARSGVSARDDSGSAGNNPFNKLRSAGINATMPRAAAMANIHASFAYATFGVPIIAAFTGFPFTVTLPTINVLDFLSIGMFPYALSFLLPMLMFQLVKEREDGVLQLMQSVGLRMRHYWVSFFLFAFLLYMLVLAVFMALGFGLQMRFFMQTSMLIFLPFALLWGVALISMASMFSLAFTGSRTASLVGYLFIILVVNFGIFFNFNVYGDRTPSLGYLSLAPFAFYRALYVMTMRCMTLTCVSTGDFRETELPRILVALLVEIAIMLLVTAYGSQVRDHGCCFACQRCRRRALVASAGGAGEVLLPLRAAAEAAAAAAARHGLRPTSSSSKSGASGSPPRVGALGIGAFVDDDVLAEEARVFAEPDLARTSPIYVRNVVKEYVRGKLANQHVSFAMQPGECFGLLGPNGAGKTTLISILVGLQQPTSGDVYVAGHSMTHDSFSARLKLGICPQHERLWEELTVREHVLFYARLKGVPPVEERVHVERLLRDVELHTVAERRASELSGGMRRRLSVAISLAGDVEVVLMDEPSTGLDPHTRRQLWDVIAMAHRRASLLITTHRMDEADALCTRIGIMATGRLRCLGTQHSLKTKYGNGYALRVTFASQDDAPRADAFVRTVVPSADALRTSLCSAVYQVPAASTHLATVFRAMQERGRDNGVREFSLSQTSLEDVFTNVLELAKEDA